MATLTLYPESDNSVQCTVHPSGTHTSCVISDDGSASYVYSPANGNTKTDLFNFQNCGLSNVAINSLTFYATVTTQGRSGTTFQYWRINGIEAAGCTEQSNWGVWSKAYTTNPATGLAWTPTTIDALVAGFKLVTLSGTEITAVTYFYVVVNYTVLTVPVVTTTAISEKRPKTATSGGNVTSSDSAVTAKGICWNLTGNPTIANSKTNNGTGLGAFTSYMTGLLSKRTYHVRAYATSAIGTGYGAEVDFTTPAVPQIISF